MKKILTTLFMASMLLSAQAGLNVSIITLDENEEEVITYVTKDTTIVVTEYEEDFFSGKPVMSVKGNVSTTSKTMKVTLQRSAAEVKDEFCLGNCFPGNEETTQVFDNIAITQETNSWFTHFYPATAGTTTIKYTFEDGVNPAISLTVKYAYQTTAIENTVVSHHNGKIFNLLGQEMPATELSELPKGIYIINGKKYIKQ